LLSSSAWGNLCDARASQQVSAAVFVARLVSLEDFPVVAAAEPANLCGAWPQNCRRRNPLAKAATPESGQFLGSFVVFRRAGPRQHEALVPWGRSHRFAASRKTSAVFPQHFTIFAARTCGMVLSRGSRWWQFHNDRLLPAARGAAGAASSPQCITGTGMFRVSHNQATRSRLRAQPAL
jgi:hypothetical protein